MENTVTNPTVTFSEAAMLRHVRPHHFVDSLKLHFAA